METIAVTDIDIDGASAIWRRCNHAFVDNEDLIIKSEHTSKMRNTRQDGIVKGLFLMTFCGRAHRSDT